MKNKFNIKKIIKRYELNIDDLAKVLFPSVKYPEKAFNRILRGKANLDTEQLERLAEYIGVFISDLFPINTWKGSNENECLTLIKGPYKIKVNYKGAYISLFINNELIEQIVANTTSMSLDDFIEYINSLIKNYENGNN